MGITVKQPDIELSDLELGQNFANSNSREQAEFLIYMAYTIRNFPAGGWWSRQCRAITDEAIWKNHTDTNIRQKVILYLEDLVDHLKDPTNESPTNA